MYIRGLISRIFAELAEMGFQSNPNFKWYVDLTFVLLYYWIHFFKKRGEHSCKILHIRSSIYHWSVVSFWLRIEHHWEQMNFGWLESFV